MYEVWSFKNATVFIARRGWVLASWGTSAFFSDQICWAFSVKVPHPYFLCLGCYVPWKTVKFCYPVHLPKVHDFIAALGHQEHKFYLMKTTTNDCYGENIIFRCQIYRFMRAVKEGKSTKGQHLSESEERQMDRQLCLCHCRSEQRKKLKYPMTLEPTPSVLWTLSHF